jgi:DNA N-6-adenine-methyltransferase (Dam)
MAFFRQVEAEFGPFDLDPCAAPQTAKAPKFYTRAEDGLIQPWFGRVWLNPPYSQKGRWAQAACYWIEHGAELIVALLPARTDSACNRLRFDDRLGKPGKGGPPAGNLLAIYRKEAR